MGAACGRHSEASPPRVDDDDVDSGRGAQSDDEDDVALARRLAAAQPVTPSQRSAAVPSLAGGSRSAAGGRSPGGGAAGPDVGRLTVSDSIRTTSSSASDSLPSGVFTPPPGGSGGPPGVTSPTRLRWQRGELLGTGAFGRVFLGLNEDTGELLAVKEVLLSGSTMERAAEQLRSLEAEVDLMRSLSHPNLVRYLGTERTPQALHILLEYVPGGSIASLLQRFGAFAEKLVAVYTRQILEGLHYLHTHHIMHRDIKGANILVDNAGCVKLADFGASRRLADLVTMESGCKSVKGTPYWMAPEVIKQTGHGRQADIWSVACTVIEMATAKPPWSDFTTPVSAMFHIASAKGPPPLPGHISHEARDFLLLCFNRVPKERPNAGRLLQHPFITAAWSGGADNAAGGGGGTPRGSSQSNGGVKRTFSAIAELQSPSVTPSTGPRTGGGTGVPRTAWGGATPATGDLLLSSATTTSSGATPLSAGASLTPGLGSAPSADEDGSVQALRRRLQLQGSTPTPGDAAASAGRPAMTDSVAFNPMQEPSWTGATPVAPPAGQSESRGGGSDGPEKSSSPALPADDAVAPLTPRGAAPARVSDPDAVRPQPPAAVVEPPATGEGTTLSRASSVESEAIASRLAVQERERLAAQEQARQELRRSKQAQWELELQRELEEQRAQQRQREQADSEALKQLALNGSAQRRSGTSKQ